MALDAKVTKMLNDFADSQPALRLPAEPAGSSNPKLGDSLNDAMAAYEAADAGDWSGTAPKTIKEALDRLAAALGPIA